MVPLSLFLFPHVYNVARYVSANCFFISTKKNVMIPQFFCKKEGTLVLHFRKYLIFDTG